MSAGIGRNPLGGRAFGPGLSERTVLMVEQTREWLVSLRVRLYRAIDSDEVRLLQAIVNVGMLSAGFYMISYGVPTTVRIELGGTMHLVWVVMCVVGPALVGLGDWLVSSGEKAVLSSQTTGGGSRVYWGWYFQMGGDFATTCVYATYVIAAFSSAWLQRGIFAAFVMSSLGICAAILVYRDIRRIRAIERL